MICDTSKIVYDRNKMFVEAEKIITERESEEYHEHN